LYNVLFVSQKPQAQGRRVSPRLFQINTMATSS